MNNDILNMELIMNNIHKNHIEYGELTYQQLWEILNILSDKYRYMYNLEQENKANLTYKDQQNLSLKESIIMMNKDLLDQQNRINVLENKMNTKLTFKERVLGKINKV